MNYQHPSGTEKLEVDINAAKEIAVDPRKVLKYTDPQNNNTESRYNPKQNLKAREYIPNEVIIKDGNNIIKIKGNSPNILSELHRYIADGLFDQPF